MILFKNGEEIDHCESSYAGRRIFISIDSSKSNSAMVVGTPGGVVLDDYEFNGAGGEVDVYDLCRDIRKQLRLLFKGAIIEAVGIEDIITKNGYHKGGDYHPNMGLDVHQSRAKITAVFNNFIFAFEEFYGIRPITINNWEWKSDILPEQYRTREHHKGSQDYLIGISPKWIGRSDDVTDAVCIFMHMNNTIKYTEVRDLTGTDICTVKYVCRIAPTTVKLEDGRFVKFEIHNDDSIEHNIATVANRITQNQIGYLELNTDQLTIEQIYNAEPYLPGGIMFDKFTERLYVLIEKDR